MGQFWLQVELDSGAFLCNQSYDYLHFWAASSHMLETRAPGILRLSSPRSATLWDEYFFPRVSLANFREYSAWAILGVMSTEEQILVPGNVLIG